MPERSRILLVHSDIAWMTALQEELGDRLETVTASTPEDAWRQLDRGKIELVVAQEDVGVGFLEDLSRRAPGTPRAILLNGGDRRTWVGAAAEGHDFIAIPEHAPDLAPRLRALVLAETEKPRALSGCTAEIRAAGDAALVMGPLLRFTSETVVARVEVGDALDYFLPGSDLDRVVVRRGSRAVLETHGAVVQGLRPDAGGGYELEMALGTRCQAARARKEEVVLDPLHRASLLMEAIRRRLLVMDRTDGPTAHALARGRVDPLTDMLVLEETPPGFGPGAAVRFSFDAGGAHYRFFTALSEHHASGGATYIAALLPLELRGQRRARPRVQFAAGEAVVDVVPLLGSGPVRRTALDVDMEGTGFLAEPGDLLPVGTRLHPIRMLLPDGVTLQASGRIVSRSALQGGSGPRPVRCGVQLEPLAPGDESALAGAILKRTHPGLELARGLTFDGLWCFLRECGFIYPEKEEKLQASLPEIRSTMSRLLESPHGPLRTLVFRSGPGALLQGHVSVLRAYRGTWMIQHLAARKEGPGSLAAAKALNAGMAEYLEQLPDVEWARIWFRPKNRWPARTFGRFARLKFDQHRCDLRTYSYMTASTQGAVLVEAPGVKISFATAADWAEIRRSFVARGDTALLAAEDLTRSPDLSEIGDVYHQMDLHRGREALVARRDGRLLGFVLLETASAGLNLSGLTGAFRMHALVDEPTVTTALAARARQRYGELGQPLAVGLVQVLDAAAWEAAGFTKVKEYTCLTAHRSLWRRYLEFVQRLYECSPACARPRS